MAKRIRGTCSIGGCGRPHEARGWCATHYALWRKHGDPLFKVNPFHAAPLLDRFCAKFVKRENGCWEWVAALTPKGYGDFGVQGMPRHLAHRWSYELFVGPVPEGQEIDHLCHTNDPTCTGGDACLHRRCVNPSHLEAVTHVENNERAAARRRTE